MYVMKKTINEFNKGFDKGFNRGNAVLANKFYHAVIPVPLVFRRVQ